MAEPHEVSHLEIYRLLIEVKTTLDMALKQRAEDKEREGKEKTDIFKRIGELEKRPDPTGMAKELADVKTRVAQGAILLAALAAVSPLLWQSLAPRVHFQTTPPSIASPQ